MMPRYSAQPTSAVLLPSRSSSAECASPTLVVEVLIHADPCSGPNRSGVRKATDGASDAFVLEWSEERALDRIHVVHPRRLTSIEAANARAPWSKAS